MYCRCHRYFRVGQERKHIHTLSCTHISTKCVFFRLGQITRTAPSPCRHTVSLSNTNKLILTIIFLRNNKQRNAPTTSSNHLRYDEAALFLVQNVKIKRTRVSVRKLQRERNTVFYTTSVRRRYFLQAFNIARRRTHLKKNHLKLNNWYVVGSVKLDYAKWRFFTRRASFDSCLPEWWSTLIVKVLQVPGNPKSLQFYRNLTQSWVSEANVRFQWILLNFHWILSEFSPKSDTWIHSILMKSVRNWIWRHRV